MLASALNQSNDSSCAMRMGGLWLLLVLCAPCCCSGAPDTGLPKRTLLQQQQPQELLSALSDAPDNDPFASAHIGKPFLSRFAALVPKSLQHQLQLLKHSLSRVAEEHDDSSGGHAHTAIAHHRRHHHRVVRHNTTHTWVHSPVLQLELPQPWDDINLTTIVRDNLEPDISFWAQLHRQPSVADILDMAKNHPDIVGHANTRRLVELRANKLRFPLMPPGQQQYLCDETCDPQLMGFVDALHAAVQVYNLSLPDVLFIINTADVPVCTEEQAMRDECRAPVISISKEIGVADLVGPVMKRSDAEVHARHLPWEEKLDKAFFRGVPSCGIMPFPPACARSWLARMAQLNHSQELDVGVVERYDRPDQVKGDPVLQDGHGPLPVLQKVPMKDLPKYKYLLNLDGHTAAYRLGHLLATNSLVLKQESNQVEHYYRSLRAYHHYVPILKHSEFDVIPRLQWARQHQTQVRHIVHNANRFALKYATYPARVLYWKYVLIAYRGLFPDMDEYFKQSSETGSQMEYLLKSQLTKILRQHGQNATISFTATAPTGTSRSRPAGQMDAAVQEELDRVAAFAGEDEADEQEQQLAVLPDEGGGVDETLLSLTDSDY